MDEADRSFMIQELTIASSIYLARSQPKQGIYPTGYCLNCDDPIEGSLLFCDHDCELDYRKRQRQKTLSG